MAHFNFAISQNANASFYFASFCKWIEVIEENAIVIRFLFFFWKFNSLLISLLSRPNWRIV